MTKEDKITDKTETALMTYCTDTKKNLKVPGNNWFIIDVGVRRIE